MGVRQASDSITAYPTAECVQSLNACGIVALTQRHYGVEIEHGNHRMVAASVLNRMRQEGFPIGARQLGVRPECYTQTYDGSGVEIRTPALKGTQGLEELKNAMEFLTSIGGFTGRADGMHVHHEAYDYIDNGVAILALTDSWIANRNVLRLFVDKYRWAALSCAAVSKKPIDDTVKGRSQGFPRGDLNFGSLLRHGTIEIRLHEGTLNPITAAAWVVFGQAFIEKVIREKAFGNKQTPAKLLEHLGVADKYAKVLHERAVANA